jgi:hypothetical protein
MAVSGPLTLAVAALSPMSAFERIVLQNSFGSLKTNFPGDRRGDRIIVWGTTATSDELTGNFGSAPQDTSIDDCPLVALFAEKSLQAIFGVLQHYRALNGLNSDIAPCPLL